MKQLYENQILIMNVNYIYAKNGDDWFFDKYNVHKLIKVLKKKNKSHCHGFADFYFDFSNK